MRQSCLALFIALALTVPVAGQKRWADANEYELQRAAMEADPYPQIALLLEWERTYPNSEFQQERIVMFTFAYARIGRPLDAFIRATQLLKLDASDMRGLYIVAALAPSLQAPSREHIKLTEESARSLLSRRYEVGLKAAVVSQRATDSPSTPLSDPDTERVAQLIQEWRRVRPIRHAEDAEAEIRRVGERALAWAKSVTP